MAGHEIEPFDPPDDQQDVTPSVNGLPEAQPAELVGVAIPFVSGRHETVEMRHGTPTERGGPLSGVDVKPFATSFKDRPFEFGDVGRPEGS